MRPATGSSRRAAARLGRLPFSLTPAGALIVFNRPDEPSFDEFTVRRLARFARQLARSATQDLDSLTGLLT